jgi:hypothetical protein
LRPESGAKDAAPTRSIAIDGGTAQPPRSDAGSTIQDSPRRVFKKLPYTEVIRLATSLPEVPADAKVEHVEELRKAGLYQVLVEFDGVRYVVTIHTESSKVEMEPAVRE